jgi:hypothetical protein
VGFHRWPYKTPNLAQQKCHCHNKCLIFWESFRFFPISKSGEEHKLFNPVFL